MASNVYRKGILSEPLDLDAPQKRRIDHPKVPARPGLYVSQRGTNLEGTVVSTGGGAVVIRDQFGRDHRTTLRDGGFDVDGQQVTLIPAKTAGPKGPTITASGSIAAPGAPARIARASRILVEGIHDAELIELVWGDDLRDEGIVVETLDGADNLAEVVRAFGPRSGRRLGILLDHLVDGSKEHRIAAGVDHPDVLVTGHPYVDIWAAVKPKVVGIDAWPDIPKGQPWKEGVCAALGVDASNTGAFWKQLRNKVHTYADLEPPLVGAVEQLIDFVTEPG